MKAVQKMVFVLACALALLVPTRGDAKPTTFAFDRSDGPTIVLSGGDVHVGDGRVLTGGSVEIRGTRIVRVSAAGGSPAAGATVVDVTGKWVTPGLIGADTRLGLSEISAERSTRDTVRASESPIRAGYDASTAIHADSALLAVQAIDGITTAAVSPAGGLLSGQIAWIDLVAGHHLDIVSKRSIAIAGSLGQVYADSRAATLAALREVLDDTRFYRARRADYDRRQLRDVAAHRLDLEALVPLVEGRIPLTVRADRVSDILALIELAREQRLRVVILGGAQAWRIGGAIAAAKVPVILQPSDNLPADFDRLGARLDAAALLHAAGVEVGIAVLEEPHNVRNLKQEAGIAVAYGLPAEVALQAVTLTIARAYGLGDDYGSLEAGKVANVVVWDSDPFELGSQPRAVYVRGESIPLESRQTRLRDRYRDLGRFR